MNMNQRGQTLLIIVFVMVIAFSAGITSTSRLISLIKAGEEDALANSAKAIADSALERILRKSITELGGYIDSGVCPECYLEVQNPNGGIDRAQITVSYLGKDQPQLDLDLSTTATSEVNLIGYGDAKSIKLCWKPTGPTYPAIVGSLIYIDGAGDIVAFPFAYNTLGSPYTGNQFSTAVAELGYSSCLTLNSLTSPQVLRLRAFYARVNAVLIPDAGANLPSQGILIESVGTSNQVKSKVTAVKSAPITPLPFDFAIFQRSSTDSLKN